MLSIFDTVLKPSFQVSALYICKPFFFINLSVFGFLASINGGENPKVIP
ncbi:hypothetical protein SAN_1379 [Streptococcus agalactiae COH1]|nr:hypothetical protein SAN_1379 [Streptococcus agalactiae COH1]